MNWDDIRIFLAVARKGSLTAAGADLRMSASSVSRHIEDLERQLGVLLFVRSQTGYALSDAGSEILADAEQAECFVIDIARKASGSSEQLSGTVRVALPEGIATCIIFPEVARFMGKHREISLEFTTNIALTNLTRREADISLRLVRPEAGNLVVRRIGQMATALYASSEYLERHSFNVKSRGKGHFIVSWDEMFGYLQANQWLNDQLPDARVVFRTTSLQGKLSACSAGVGLAVLPCLVADKVPNLSRVMDPEEVLIQDIWLVVHHDISKLSRIRVVAQFLQDTIHENHSVLLGR